MSYQQWGVVVLWTGAAGLTAAGAGNTPGPAMAFGYLAGKHAAARATEDTER